VHFSHRMVVLLGLKYLNFPADDGILLFFVHFGFLVLLILSGCLGRGEWVYLSASSIPQRVLCVLHVDFFYLHFTLPMYFRRAKLCTFRYCLVYFLVNVFVAPCTYDCYFANVSNDLCASNNFIF
jgi:hypothetical protein